MKNIIIAAALAFLGWTQAGAQDIQTKSAPDLPTFKVTVDVTNGPGGSSVLINADGTFVLDRSGSVKLNYNASPTLSLVADTLYMLESLTINGSQKTLEATFPTGEKDNNKGHNTYTKTLANLKEKQQITIVWKEKPEVILMISGTEQIVNEKEAAKLAIITDIQGLTVSPSYFMDKECSTPADEGARKKIGTYYAKIHIDETADYKGVDRIIPMVVTKKKELEASSAPSTSDVLEEGQPLATASITGEVKLKGKGNENHLIGGTWSWVNPNQGVKSGINDYQAVFIPDSAAIYIPLSANVSVVAKPVSTVTLKQTDGGIISIKDATADNKYVGEYKDTGDKIFVNPKVTFIATPQSGYAFNGWKGISKTVEGTPKEETVTTENVFISSDVEVSAVFVKATREITIDQKGTGTLKVMNGTQVVETGAQVPVGTNLTIVTEPGEGQMVETSGYKINTNDNKSAEFEKATNFIVSVNAKSYEVYATFASKPSTKHLVKMNNADNGTLALKDGTETVNLNSAVKEGKVLSVIPLPNHGYRLASLRANGQNIQRTLSFDVKEETQLIAAFEPESYDVTIVQQQGGTINKSTQSIPYKGKMTGISATAEEGYKLVNLLVNNNPVAIPYDLEVEGATVVTALYQKLAVLEVLNQDEEVIYSGKANEIAVKTAGNIGGFKVTYRKEGTNEDTEAIEVGTYLVTITREADQVYAAVNKTVKLTVKPGIPGISLLPTDATTGLTAGVATVAGKWTTEKPGNDHPAALRSGDGFTTVYFIPDDKNIGYVVTTVPSTAKSKAEATVTLPSTLANGSLQLMNGDVPVTSLTKYEGQRLTLVAKADAGYKINWDAIEISGATLDGNHSFTVGKNVEIKIKAGSSLFYEKKAITKVTDKTVSKTYTGEMITLNASDLGLTPSNGWMISYSADPIDAGTYDIFLSRPEDDTYAAYKETDAAGTLTINKATIKKENIKVPLATAVQTGAPLSNSILNGGAVIVDGLPVTGKFTWTDLTTTVSEAKAYPITFTLGSGNYTMAATDLESFVSLLDAPIITVTIRIVNGGSVSLQDSEGKKIEVTKNQVNVPAGSLISIIPTDGKIQSLSASDPNATTSTNTVGNLTSYTCLAGDSDFTLTITFSTTTTPETPGTPETPVTPDKGIDVTGVSVSPTAKTLGVGETFQLTAVIVPANASDKGVAWTSSDEQIATVDENGKVTALHTGTCRITVSTNDGNKTASCEVTVTELPTGIQGIVAYNPVYTEKGAIRIDPSERLTARVVTSTGATIYLNEISRHVRIPATAGIYFVQLTKDNRTETVKVRVR